MPDFPVHHSPGNWRPIILEVSSSSENVSQKGAKFEEDPRTYSSKASRIVLPTFGILDDRDMATRSVAALAASNDVFTRSKRLNACGRQSLVTSCLSLQKTSKNGIPSIGFRDCALTVKSLLLLAREVSRD